MRKIFYTLIASFVIVFTSHAQSDSLKAIEEQQQELRLQQLRLQAKQDSLQKEQDRISAEKLKNQQQQQTQVTTPVVPAEDYNHTVIALHPLFAMFGQADFSIEQRITKSTSLYLEMAYHDFNLRENGTAAAMMPGDWIAYTGYRAELQLRYYVLPEARALYKLYLAPHVYFKQDEVSRGEGQELSNNNGQRRQYEYYNQYQGQALGAGINIGYQIQFLRHLTFDSNVGTNYSIPLTNKMLTDRAHLPLINPYKEGMTLRMNLSIGFAF